MATAMTTTLSEDRAWAIAMQACAPLCDYVRLAGDFEARRSVVSSYQWIDIDTPEPDELDEVGDEPGLATTLAWVRKAREACAVLHLLASCAGFRGHENEVFWKRVFDYLSPRALKTHPEDVFGDEDDPDEDSDPNLRCVGDGARFFDGVDGEEGLGFPRFRLKVPLSLQFDEPPDPEVTARFWETQANDPTSMLSRMMPGADAREFEALGHALSRIRGQGRPPTHEGGDDGSVDEFELDEDDDDVDMEAAYSGDYGLDMEAQHERDGDVGIENSWDWFDAIVRTFGGLRDIQQTPSLIAIVNELLPHVDPKRYFEKPVEIGVLMTESYPLKHIAGKIQGIISDFARDSQRISYATCTDRLKSGELRFPVVKFSTFDVQHEESMEDHKELQHLTEIIEKCEVIIPNVALMASAMLDEETLMRFIYSLMIGNGSANLQNISLELGEASTRQIEIIFSAIPRLNVTSLFLENASGNLGRVGWAWLAYGLYHPWACNSRLVELDLRTSDVSGAEASPLRSKRVAVATLYDLIHGSSHNGSDVVQGYEVTERYAIVGVTCGASCFFSSNLGGEPLHVFKAHTLVTAIIKRNVDCVDKLDNAVCVVISGRGHGWVAKSDILQLRWELCGKPPIRGLALFPPFANRSVRLRDLAPLIEWVDYLDIIEWGSLKAPDLLDLFRVCPNLKELATHSNGDAFSTWTSETALVDERLQALRLRGLKLVCYNENGSICAPSPAAWQTCLRDLRSVVIQTYEDRGRHERSVRKFFRDGYMVDRFQWNCCLWDDSIQTGFHQPSYEDKRMKSRDELGVQDGVNDKAQRPMSPRARAAFISVIKEMSQVARHSGSERSHPIGTLSLDVAKVICGFSTTDVKRVVWMEDR